VAGISLIAATAESPFPKFEDAAFRRGLTLSNRYGGVQKKKVILETTGNGVALIDYDNDGDNDLLFTNGTTLDRKPVEPLSTIQLYRNDGGKFTDVSRAAGFREEGWAQGVCAGDYDNDGRVDILITYYGHNRLFRNRGNGTFQDVTGQAGLPTTGIRFGSGCAFFDYDRDGHLDFAVANYADIDLAKVPQPGTGEFCRWKDLPVMCGPRGLPMARTFLYRNRGDGTFEDVSQPAGISKAGLRYGLGVVAADFDNDGLPDFYVACDMTPSMLFHNRGDGTFEERGVAAGVAYNYDGQLQAGMGVAIADYNADGFLDIAKTNFSGDLPSLYRNEDGKFLSDVSLQSGLAANHLLGWGIAFGDFDEDGWPDLVIANGHVYPEVEGSSIGERYPQQTLIYRNLGTGKFLDMTASAGPAFQTLRPARGLAVGNLTGDGRPSIVIVNMNRKPSLLVPSGPRQNYIHLTLQGTKSNRSAIGARVTVGTSGHRQFQEVASGGSFYSQNDLGLHFGLEKAQKIDRLEVRWPSGARQTFQSIQVNRKLKLIEGGELAPN